MLSKTEKQIINFVQGDLPLESSPYNKISRRLNISQDLVIKKIKALKEKGYISRFGALVKHDKVGLKANCMCVWRIPTGKIGKIGKYCSRQNAISHCYLRKIRPEWPYNFYTMIHAKNKNDCIRFIKSIAEKFNITDYQMLFTLKQFKKTSPVYKL